jgi:hypothetical protein
LRNPIELRVGNRTIRLKNAFGNLSAGGLFIQAADLPVNTPVHVKIAAATPFEADGVVRVSEPHSGVGIEFTTITEANRKRLDELIGELVNKEALAS